MCRQTKSGAAPRDEALGNIAIQGTVGEKKPQSKPRTKAQTVKREEGAVLEDKRRGDLQELRTTKEPKPPETSR